MPSTPAAIDAFLEHDVLFGPAKAANAGGVACSGLEMSQNSIRYPWSFQEVDEKIHQIMRDIFAAGASAAEEYHCAGNLVAGSNIAGFHKVCMAMIAEGIV